MRDELRNAFEDSLKNYHGKMVERGDGVGKIQAPEELRNALKACVDQRNALRDHEDQHHCTENRHVQTA